MKKKIVFVIVMYCFIVGCNSNNITGDIDVGDVKVGDVNTGDVNTGNTDVGDIDTGDIDTGIYVKLEVDDIYSVEWECDGQSSGCLNASNGALETDCYLLLTTDIIDKAEREGKPVDFTITAKTETGEVFSKEAFTYEPGTKRMELTISEEYQ